MNSVNVLEITELRQHILAHAGNSTLAACARVNKGWSNAALEILWDKMVCVLPLLKILGPMELTDGGTYAYTEHEDARRNTAKWTRLMIYGRRVRRLSINIEISASVVNELGISRPSLSLTPNLKELRICLSTFDFRDVCFLFLHAHIRNLTLMLARLPGIEEFAKNVLQRARGARKLNVLTTSKVKQGWLSGLLVKALPQLQELAILELPQNALTAQLMTALRGNKALKEIGIFRPTLPCISPISPIPLSQQDLFPPITALQAKMCFADAGAFIANLPSLDSLWIVSDAKESATSLYQLLGSISSTIPHIRKLTVDVPNASDFQNLFGEPGTSEFGSSLEPISELKQLKELSFTWNPSQFGEEYLLKLLSKTPQIERLCLNSFQVPWNGKLERSSALGIGVLPRSALGIGVLPLIAWYCRSLRHLTLFVNSNNIPTADMFLRKADGACRSPTTMAFTHLETLNFGLSFVRRADTEKLALYLSCVLPPVCRIEGYGVWADVQRLTKILFVARRQERKELELQIRALEERFGREPGKGEGGELSHEA